MFVISILILKRWVVFDVVDFLDCFMFKMFVFRGIFFFFRLGFKIFLGVIYVGDFCVIKYKWIKFMFYLKDFVFLRKYERCCLVYIFGNRRLLSIIDILFIFLGFMRSVE